MSSPAADGRADVALSLCDDDNVEVGWAAAGYHRLSSFGYFVEPSPPFLSCEGEEAGSATRPPPLDVPLGSVLQARHSLREFGSVPVPCAVLDMVLRAAYGRVSTADEEERRTVPSAGALYPLRLIVIARDVAGLPGGAYRWRPADGQLGELADVRLPDSLAHWFRARHVEWQHAGAVIFVVADVLRACAKYGERGYRYALLEAGHVGQNICLAATALAVPHIPIGGFDDDVVNSALGLDVPAEVVVYSVVLGGRREVR